mgnify:CR=1 FL=1
MIATLVKSMTNDDFLDIYPLTKDDNLNDEPEERSYIF